MLGKIWRWFSDGDPKWVAQEVKAAFDTKHPGCRVKVVDGDYGVCAEIWDADGKWITRVIALSGRDLPRKARKQAAYVPWEAEA